MTPKMPQPAPAPAMPEPVRIPSPMDPDVMAARKTKTADEFMNRKGRDSTRLAGGADGSYSRTTLG